MTEGSNGPGLVRRVRRAANLSQRDLASRLGVSQSTVARWETGETSPPFAIMEQAAEMAGLQVVLLGEQGDLVEPMCEGAARDRAGRRYPAHVDLRADGWWVPPGSHLTVEGLIARGRSRQAQVPQVHYALRFWRGFDRAVEGTPDDHPTQVELVEQVLRREARHRARLDGLSEGGDDPGSRSRDDPVT